MPRVLPYGSWPSPISAAEVATAAPRIEGARFVGDGIWWGQSVPDEGGRIAVRRRDDAGSVVDVLPAPWNARSRVHEYGGGAWTASDDGTLFFVEKTDQCVWACRPGQEPSRLTPTGLGMRFGELQQVGDEVWAVRETHDTGSRVPPRDIVAIPCDGSAADRAGAIRSVVAGSDFVACPRVSPDGTRLAWIAWDHPDMPWDATRLRVGDLADGQLERWITVVGAPPDAGANALGDPRQSVLQPEWVAPRLDRFPTPEWEPQSELLYLTDVTGRWNLRQLAFDSMGEDEAVAPADADTGGALWNLGLRWYGVLGDGRIVAVRTNGADQVVVIDRYDGTVTPLAVPATAGVLIEDVRGSQVLISGAGSVTPSGLWLADVATGSVTSIVGGPPVWGEEWMPRPRAVTVNGRHGPVHAFDYPPTNPGVIGPDREHPPYVVMVHGGPTSHVDGAASGKFTYLTSRGIGVLDVNYGGSTGYGRAYRERLRGQWGIVDVDDVIAAAAGLAETGVADRRRLAIAGGSAGGWTVLCALLQSEVFAAGISRYGVADLRRLAADTHDFEARYLDGLVGPLPDAEQVYIDRSPLSRLERLTTPMLIEQGLEDAVVPPSQSEAVRGALAANGIRHAYLAFAGEGHGFRRAETIVAQLEAEVAFLGEVLGFVPDGIPPLPLD